ncbi:MAG: MarR family transcriptional regulator [Pelagimonas sp.]
MSRQTVAEILKSCETHWPSSLSPHTALILGLYRLRDIVSERTAPVVQSFGLSEAGFDILVMLRAQPEPYRLTPSDLYRSLIMTSGGVTKVLKSLEENGWITRIAHPEDKRSSFVQLTTAGADHAENVIQAVSKNDADIFSAALTKEQHAQLVDTLLSALDKLENDRV